MDWLSDYVEIDKSAEAVAEILSDIGLNCEGIEEASGDTVIDLEVTSNRGDCLGHIGVARELAVATGKELMLPAIELPKSDKDVSEAVQVEIAEPELCGRYTARVIEGVKVGPSPGWMRKRLEAVGVRCVNNVVDATNYAMMETGQPPHAFDHEKISGGKIIVRTAKQGERIVSIDESVCELNTDMLVIADADKPVALAGVMGGVESEISDATETILLEDAHFDPVTVRTTSRRLALPSDSAFRFERVVDIEKIDWASRRTAQLITQVAGGAVLNGVVDVYPGKQEAKIVTMRLVRLCKLLGVKISVEEVIKILSGLGFQPVLEKDDCFRCTVPSWRSDICREVDLIEEVARVHGYDKIPTEKKINIEVARIDERQKLAERIGTFLNGCGFYEAVNVTFVDESEAGLFTEDGTKKHLTVRDVSRKSSNLLRQTLIGSLLNCLKTNYNARNTPCNIYELATTFTPSKDKQPIEKMKLALVCDGDFRELRGAVESLAKSINADVRIDFRPVEVCWAQTGAAITSNGDCLGRAGIVSQNVLDSLSLKNVTPCAAELEFDVLLKLAAGEVKVKPIPKFPAIERDLSVIVDESVSWSDISDAVKTKTSSALEEIKFVGIYRGDPIAAGKKSLTLALRFRDEDGTLTHEKVDKFEQEILAQITKAVKGEIRKI